MSELDDRYERGQETRRMFGGGQITPGPTPGAWDIAPDLERILGEALFGTILEASSAESGAAGDGHPVLSDSDEPRGSTEAAFEQCPERGTDS